MRRPNIIWIGLDQLRADTLAPGPGKVCRTPFIDRLAAGGTAFSRAYTPCSLCSPARASMLTGLYAFAHGMGTNCDMYHSLSAELRQPEQQLHRAFGEAGYRTGFVGKWHVGTALGPVDYGFEGMNIPGYGNIQEDPGFRDYLKRSGFAYHPEPMYYLNPDRQTLIGGRWGGPVESTPAHYLTDYTMELIDRLRADGEPFFATCQYWEPHGPHMPSDEFYGMHDRNLLEPWASLHEDMSRKPRRIERELDSFFRSHPRTWEEAREIVGLYYDTTAMLDYEIGRLLEWLADSGLLEETIVVLSADHGDMTGAHGGMMDKGLLYEEAHHIPLIFSRPGHIASGECRDLAMNMDIMPTLMELSGIPLPEGLHGISLAGALNRFPDRTVRDELYLEFHGLRFLYSQRALVTEEGWKYVFTPGDWDEVYDLNHDPGELHNLIGEEGAQETIRQLRQRIHAASERYGDPLRDCIGKFFGNWRTGSGQVDASRFYERQR